MQSDNIKLIFTYTIATILIIGGGLMLYLTRLDPPETSSGLNLIVAGFVGSAVTFVFGDQANTRGQRSFQAGLNTPTPPAPNNNQVDTSLTKI